MAATKLERRFTIFDGMVLIAATAAGLAWSSAVWQTVPQPITPFLNGTWKSLGERVALVASLALPCLVSWTIALPILRLRRPRPSWRRIAGQAGLSACVAAALGLLAFGLLFAAAAAHANSVGKAVWADSPLIDQLTELLLLAAPISGFGVALTWALLALQRRWRCEPVWVDRAGRALGALWIGLVPPLGMYWWSQELL